MYLASLALNVLSLGLPIVILQVYDRILPNQATDTLFWLTAGLCVVLLLEWFFRMARAYIAGWAAAQYEHQASCRAVDRMLGANIGEFEKEAPGVHLDRIQAIDTLRDYYAGQARLWLVDLPFVALFLGLFWFIGGELVIVPLALLGMLFGSALLVGDELKHALADRAEVDHRRFSFVIEVLSGIHTAKLLAMEPLLQRRYERLQERGASNTYRAVFFSNFAQSLGSLVSSLTMISVVLLGSVYVMKGALTIGGLAACTLLAGRTIQPLLRALGLWTQYQSIDVAQKRLDKLFKLEPEATKGRAKAPKLAGGISLRDVSFGYDDKQKPILSGLELDVAPGEAIGISGDTGSGKSTLLMLMRGLLTPTTGIIQLDGKDISEWDPYSVRSQIGYLPQRTVLFQGTILENLTMFGGPEAIEDALAAARNLGLDDVIHRLPAGYATKVGDGAEDDLPPGIKQGIAIARVLAARPRIVLFDEANNAFDRKSDDLLKEALEGLCGETTLVLVSHRPSILALADRIHDLRDGKLVYLDESPPPPALDAPDTLQALIREIAGLKDYQRAPL